MRPYGTAFTFMGYDDHKGFQIYTTDPAGNFSKWKAIATGQGEDNINSLL